jgi:hypothetical protein
LPIGRFLKTKSLGGNRVILSFPEKQSLMSDPVLPSSYVGSKRKNDLLERNFMPTWITIPAVAFAISMASGGSVLLGRVLVWWLPFAVAAIFFFGPLLTNEPLHRRLSLSIAGASTVALSYVTIPLFMLLYEWDWYERYFNDKGSGPIGFFIFTSIFVVLPAYLIYLCLVRFLGLTKSQSAEKSEEPSDATLPRSWHF